MTDVRDEGGATAAASGPGPSGKTPMREVLIEAAFQLFMEHGFERTTVDDIVARAGVGRRSFFRYFPSKEDVVFPEHERCLTEMSAFLAASTDDEPLDAVCDAARLVMRMYAANPEFSVQRYRLTREVPSLRGYELSVVHRYERTLAHYLRQRYAGDPNGALRAEVQAAAVVAAHNNGLRAWLRGGGHGDAAKPVDQALTFVRQTWDDAGESTESGTAPTPDDDVIVMVAPRGAPMWRVVQKIEKTLGDE
ncbi:TetR family transcriptional regulator [Streptomyces himastatinicus ATCC 53653]|uniref:TetR family transcriptional regulator n=2 Tax=Streptomyces TaxID=1883 RepID=D9WG06_9ACTN|nr:TetR family transcriptional regulator [Streptomyces himastatinicus ATCC 53653]